MNSIIFSSVSMSCKNIGNEDLAMLNIAIQLGGDVKRCNAYETLKYLFTENGGLKMHKETEDAFVEYVYQRLCK